MLFPVGWIHGVLSDEFKLTEAIVPIVRSSSGVDDEILPGRWVGKLFWSFIRGQANIDCAIVWRLFPWLIWLRDDGALGNGAVHSPWVRHLGNAQHRWPTSRMLARNRSNSW